MALTPCLRSREGLMAMEKNKDAWCQFLRRDKRVQGVGKLG